MHTLSCPASGESALRARARGRMCVCVYLCVYGHRRVTELLSTRSPMSYTNKLPPLYLKCACCHILNIVNNSTHAVSSVVASIYIVEAGSRPLLKSCFLFFSHTLDDSQTQDETQQAAVSVLEHLFRIIDCIGGHVPVFFFKSFFGKAASWPFIRTRCSFSYFTHVQPQTSEVNSVEMIEWAQSFSYGSV